MSEPTTNDIFNPPQSPPPWQNTAVWPPVTQLTLRNGEAIHLNPATAVPGVIQADDIAGGGLTIDARYLTCLSQYAKLYPAAVTPAAAAKAIYPWEVRATKDGLDPTDYKYDPAKDGNWVQVSGQPNVWVEVVDAPKTATQNLAAFKSAFDSAYATYAATIK